MTSTVTSKGQVTIPLEVRKRLRIVAGTKLEFIVRENGSLEVIPLFGSIRDLKGSVPRPKKALTLAEMNAAIAEGARR